VYQYIYAVCLYLSSHTIQTHPHYTLYLSLYTPHTTTTLDLVLGGGTGGGGHLHLLVLHDLLLGGAEALRGGADGGVGGLVLLGEHGDAVRVAQAGGAHVHVQRVGQHHQADDDQRHPPVNSVYRYQD